MVKHYNPTVSQNVQRIFNLKAGDSLGSDVGNMLVPVVNIYNVCDVIVDNLTSGNNSWVVYTTPTGKDFYLTSCSLSMIKDVTATSTYSKIQVVVNGVAVFLCNIAGITLTPQNDSISCSFPIPIKLDRGSQIRGLNSASTANISVAINIQGYTVETTA
jgi:hypothetical protein